MKAFLITIASVAIAFLIYIWIQARKFRRQQSNEGLRRLANDPVVRARLDNCFWCDGTRPKRAGLCAVHEMLFYTDPNIWRKVQAEIAEDYEASLQEATNDSGADKSINH